MTVNFETDLLVITSASGKQCSYLLPLLFKRWKNLRLVVHSEASLKRLSNNCPRNAQVCMADLTVPSQAKDVVQGAKAVYHIGPGFHPRETEIGYNMIDAAKAAGAEHFVYSSVLQTQLRKLMNHDCKRYVEEALMESGMNFTILQPAHFMDMIPIQALAAKPGPEIEYPALWNPSVKFSFVSLQDLADAGVKVLEEREKHYFSVYALSSIMPLSYHRICEITAEVLGKKIIAKQVPFERTVEMLLERVFGSAEGAEPRTRDAAERMLLYYNRHGLNGNPNVLEWLIGRKATTFAEFFTTKLQTK